ncbi:hypothetical protein [Pricia sp.]|uniref:hypothetical protein n=1 Tax=Pricia sp. TaxID=2268138 RepID=UPI003593DB67
MKYLGDCFFFMLMSSCFTLGAQTYSTNETKVVLVVSSKTGAVTQLELFHTFQNKKREEIYKKDNDRKFYIGLLKGSYEIKNDIIVPKENTTIIMYTDKQIFLEEYYLPADRLLPGDRFDLGKIKAEVVSSNKGELILKT